MLRIAVHVCYGTAQFIHKDNKRRRHRETRAKEVKRELQDVSVGPQRFRDEKTLA